jgi:hypothetical protein
MFPLNLYNAILRFFFDMIQRKETGDMYTTNLILFVKGLKERK